MLRTRIAFCAARRVSFILLSYLQRNAIRVSRLFRRAALRTLCACGTIILFLFVLLCLVVSSDGSILRWRLCTPRLFPALLLRARGCSTHPF
jgi:hypothetical protein